MVPYPPAVISRAGIKISKKFFIIISPFGASHRGVVVEDIISHRGVGVNRKMQIFLKIFLNLLKMPIYLRLSHPKW
jgi:hypothetical protein